MSSSSLGKSFRFAITLACFVAFFLGKTCLHSAFGKQAVTLTSEAELIKIIASSSDGGERALACKRLAVYGSSAAVPEVAKLLSDKQLASWARITLEAIAGEESKTALREAASKLDGLLLVGVINSIGNLRDSAAVEVLTAKLKEGTPEVASAAAIALGRIGNEAALASLRGALNHPIPEVQNSVAEGSIYAAEQILKSGNAKLATEVYDQVRGGKFPLQRIVEATRGAILARGEDGIPLLIEQLNSQNRKLFSVGLQTAREVESSKLGPALLAQLEKAPTDRAALIVDALAELKGKTDLNALQKLAQSGSKEVRVAAVTVLGRVGDVSVVDTLLKVAKENKDLATAVRAALVALPDDKADTEILKRLASGDDKLILIETIGLRQLEATDELVKAIGTGDEAVRAAALQSLGQTVPQAKLSTLVSQVTNPKRASDVEGAIRALKTAAIRMPDREACAATLSAALKTAPASSKSALLETVGAVGGTKALETVKEFASGTDLALRDTSTRLLGEWMTADVAPVLLDLYNKGPKDQYQDRAMRGYARVARQMIMPDDQRLEMCRTILKTAKLREQKLVFDVVKKFPSKAMVQVAVEAAKNPELTDDAKAAIQAIKPKLANNPEALALIEQAGLK